MEFLDDEPLLDDEEVTEEQPLATSSRWPSKGTLAFATLVFGGLAVLLRAAYKRIFKSRWKFWKETLSQRSVALSSRLALFLSSVKSLKSIETQVLTKLLQQIHNSLVSISSLQMSPTSIGSAANETTLKTTLTRAQELGRYLTAETYMGGFASSSYGPSASDDILGKAVAQTREELRSIKGLLLSSRNFPSVTTNRS